MMLNVIGGLDNYDSGDMIINGKSTKDFKDSDDLNNRVLYIHKMILELGITMETEWIKWLEQVIPQLKLFAQDNVSGE